MTESSPAMPTNVAGIDELFGVLEHPQFTLDVPFLRFLRILRPPQIRQLTGSVPRLCIYLQLGLLVRVTRLRRARNRTAESLHSHYERVLQVTMHMFDFTVIERNLEKEKVILAQTVKRRMI